MDELMPIGEFADRSGLSPKRLRTYAAAGLLVPAAVDSSNGYRFYLPGQLHTAKVIAELRRAGIAVAGIARFLGRPSLATFDAWADGIEEDVRERRGALERARALLALDVVEEPTHEPIGGSAMLTLTAAGTSEKGPVRDENEDHFATSDIIAVVADGLGGRNAGGTASHTAIEAFRTSFTGRSLTELEEAVRAANESVWTKARGEFEGMGTTICAVALVAGSQVGVLNVGDSRVYRLRDGELTQLTHDHTVVADLISRGELREDEARDHPYRNVLTRAIGVGPTVEADTEIVDVVAGDRVLLCTDGLFNELAAGEIAGVLNDEPDHAAAAARLVDGAIAAGGHDNVSAVVVDVRPAGS